MGSIQAASAEGRRLPDYLATAAGVVEGIYQEEALGGGTTHLSDILIEMIASWHQETDDIL